MRRGILSAHGAGVALAAIFVLGGTTRAEQPRQKLSALREKAQRRAPVRARQGRQGRAVAGIGTIQYDNDVPFSRDGNGVVVGNRFNVGVQDPHSIVSVSFRRGGANGTTAVAVIVDFPVTVIASGIVYGLPASTAGSIAFGMLLPVLSHSGSFGAGLVNGYTGTCAGNTMLGAPCDGPALTQGTMDPGMGFHAVRIYASGTNGVDIPNRNAIFRVSGDNLPVELMGFGAE